MPWLAALLLCACPPAGDDDSTPGDDDTNVTDDDTSAGDDDSTPSDDDSNPGDDDTGPGDDDTTPGDDDDTPPLDGDGDGVPAPPDCDDTDPTTYPGATEICDRLDNDCSGSPPADETDGDADGVSACEGDCDDLDPDRTPGVPEACDGVDTDCNLLTGENDDDDGDGSTVCEGDCDDSDTQIYSGFVEICDGIDNDCDPLTDEAGDGDGDGYSVVCDQDCDDTDSSTFPGAPEPCSGPDHDCDTQPPPACGSCQEHLVAGRTADGVYLIDGDGSGPDSPRNVWCDQQTQGGGWTLLMRTVWDWGQTDDLLTTYSDWRTGNPGGADAGSAFRLPGDLWDDIEVQGDHMIVVRAREATTGNTCAPQHYTWTGGTLTVDASQATLTGVTGTLAGHLAQGTVLSATDSGPNPACTASPRYAVPFFYGGCCVTCWSYQESHWPDAPHPMSTIVDQPDINGVTAATACPSGAAERSTDPSFAGVNIMEYYVR
jgi:hypothetical protein